MRNKIKIETLSSVHVGSGDKKVKDIDFLNDEKYVYFLDLYKIGEELALAQNPELADQWAKAVMKGRQIDFFRDNKVNYKRLSRRVPNYVDGFSDKKPSISMMMRDGRGLPYIPGSSLKGAIRTVLFAQLAKNEALRQSNKRRQEVEQWAKAFFGDIPNDPFRFLRVGDAFFSDSNLAVINTVQIKKSKLNPNSTEIDTIKQYVEVLLDQSKSQFTIDIDVDDFNSKLRSGIPHLKDLNSLFKLINEHTQSLVQSEMKICENVTGADSLWDTLDFIDGEIEACGPGECVMRMGNASGKRFITGGILEYFNFDQNAIPKTRRIEILEDDSHAVLGFVKLSIIKE